jgi:hypothetical protein
MRVRVDRKENLPLPLVPSPDRGKPRTPEDLAASERYRPHQHHEAQRQRTGDRSRAQGRAGSEAREAPGWARKGLREPGRVW